MTPAATGVWRSEVREADTAHALGNAGIRVLATPVLAEFCERAAADACRRAGLAPTRRLRVDIRHLAPTPVGDSVEIRATVTGVDDACVTLGIAGGDSAGAVVSGRVTRLR